MTKQAKPRPPEDTRAHVARLASDWQQQHERRSKEVEALLVAQYANADAGELLLLGLVSHDVALAETLGRNEVQLAHRALALVDNAAVGLALAKTLKQVSLVREGATRRTQEMLQSLRVIRGQRKLAEKPTLRRVV